MNSDGDESEEDGDKPISNWDKAMMLRRSLPSHIFELDDQLVWSLLADFSMASTKYPPGSCHLFDITVMTAQWHDFLTTECGLAELDPKLVDAFVARHIELFKAALGEFEATWDALTGEISASSKLFAKWGSHGTGLKVPGAVAGMWTKTFEQVAESYDDIVAGHQGGLT